MLDSHLIPGDKRAAFCTWDRASRVWRTTERVDRRRGILGRALALLGFIVYLGKMGNITTSNLAYLGGQMIVLKSGDIQCKSQTPYFCRSSNSRHYAWAGDESGSSGSRFWHAQATCNQSCTCGIQIL